MTWRALPLRTALSPLERIGMAVTFGSWGHLIFRRPVRRALTGITRWPVHHSRLHSRGTGRAVEALVIPLDLLDALDTIQENRPTRRWSRVRMDTVKTRLHRARLGLRQALADYFVERRRTAS